MDYQESGQPLDGAEAAAPHGAPHGDVDLRLEVPAVSEQVADIRRAVRTAASARGIGEPQLADIGLAVTEACANVVNHAYRDAARAGPLTVEAYRERRDFVVTVTDRGPGITPRSDSSGLGLGLALIARLTRRMEITSNAPTGSTVLMAFRLAEA
jgi:anti-sigma regulatory factor (Ser/Thr protein kinase)